MKVEPGSVNEGVGQSHSAWFTTQISPVCDAGHRCGEAAGDPHDERRVGCIAHGPGVSRSVESVEDQDRSQGPYGYVREGRVQRSTEPGAV